MVGVDPYGSILAQPPSINTKPHQTFHVEGIGYDFIPGVLDHSKVDSWVKIDDANSFQVARKLISKEGILCGGSGGANVWGAFKWLRQQGLDKDPSVRVVCLLPDGIRNYLSKFVSDEWMVQYGFLDSKVLVDTEHPLCGRRVSELDLEALKIWDLGDLDAETAMRIFESGAPAIPVRGEDGGVRFVTEDSLLKAIGRSKFEAENCVSKALTTKFVMVDLETDLTAVDALFKQGSVLYARKVSQDGQILEIYPIRKVDLIGFYRKRRRFGGVSEGEKFPQQKDLVVEMASERAEAPGGSKRALTNGAENLIKSAASFAPGTLMLLTLASGAL